jgi:hypothetical protein
MNAYILWVEDSTDWFGPAESELQDGAQELQIRIEIDRHKDGQTLGVVSRNIPVDVAMVDHNLANDDKGNLIINTLLESMGPIRIIYYSQNPGDLKIDEFKGMDSITCVHRRDAVYECIEYLSELSKK